MGIGVSGLATGLDTDSIVKKIMELERRPITLLQNSEASFQAKISAIGNLKGALSSFQTAVQALKDSSGFISYKSTSGNTDMLSVATDTGAVAGQYTVNISQLATAQQVRSSAFTSSSQVVGTGTLNISIGTGTAVAIEIDSDHNTLSGIATAINEADAGVSASVIDDGSGTYYLTLSSQTTGASNTINFTMADDDGNNTDAIGLSSLYTTPASQQLTETQAALNAQLTVNGIGIERSKNSFNDAIQGVYTVLKKADPTINVTVSVEKTSSGLESKLNEFVKQYNNLMDSVDKAQKYNAATKQGAVLFGDSTTNRLKRQITGFLYKEVTGISTDANALSKLGISLDKAGVMSFDSSKLDTVMDAHPDDVKNFFSINENGVKGFALQFDGMLEDYLKSGTGILTSKSDGLQSSITSIEKQMEQMELRISKKEDVLRSQFNSLETLMSGFQATSGQLDQQLASLANLRTQISKK